MSAGVLHQRVALITGGGSGIGRAIARRFAQEGARIAVLDRDVDAARRVAAEIAERSGVATAHGADVRDDAALRQTVDQITSGSGRIDILVNNAGISVGSDLRTITPAQWDLNIDIVLTGAARLTRLVLPGMTARGDGVLLNIASVNGLSGLGEEAYSAAKAGLINLTQNLAVRHGPDGIRANVICPGTVRTPIWAARLARDPDVFARLAAWYPLGRVGEPDDVANAALFLCSPESAWITGVVLPVDGGLTAGSFRMTHDLSG